MVTRIVQIIAQGMFLNIVSELHFLLQKIKSQYHYSQRGKYDSNSPVQGLWFCFIGKDCGNTCPDKGKDDTQRHNQEVWTVSEGEVGNGACQGGECHNEYAGSNGCLQLISQNACQNIPPGSSSCKYLSGFARVLSNGA